MSQALPAVAAGALRRGPTTLLVPLVHFVKGGASHVLSWQNAVAAAAARNGWTTRSLCTPAHGLQELPPGWEARLRGARLEQGYRRLRDAHGKPAVMGDILAQAASLVAGIRRLRAAHRAERTVLLMENFNAMHQLALLLALPLLPRRGLHCWMLIRGEPEAATLRGTSVTIVLLRAMRRQLPPGGLTLLTDTEPLREHLSASFGMPFHVLPIPHTPAQVARTPPVDGAPRLLWWPGEPRASKGLAEIQGLAAAAVAPGSAAARLRLCLAESAGIAASAQGIGVQALPRVLSPADYEAMMGRADAVLLPYEPMRYRHASSGIFTEAVVAGALPLTTAGTWMASELARFGLQALVLDWQAPALADRIAARLEDPSVREAFAAMRRHYAAYHSLPSFADTLAGLLDPAMPGTADAAAPTP